jgi:hypothetical protein
LQGWTGFEVVGAKVKLIMNGAIKKTVYDQDHPRLFDLIFMFVLGFRFCVIWLPENPWAILA